MPNIKSGSVTRVTQTLKMPRTKSKCLWLHLKVIINSKPIKIYTDLVCVSFGALFRKQLSPGEFIRINQSVKFLYIYMNRGPPRALGDVRERSTARHIILSKNKDDEEAKRMQIINKITPKTGQTKRVRPQGVETFLVLAQHPSSGGLASCSSP